MDKNNDDALTGLALARLKSIQTRNYKRLNTYVVKKATLQVKYHNELIDNLLNTGIYADIYSKVNDDKEGELTDEDILLLKTFDYISPDELGTCYK